MASYCKLLTINLRISPDIEDHVIKYTPDSMILKSEISPKTFEIFKKVKSCTGFFGVADPLDWTSDYTLIAVTYSGCNNYVLAACHICSLT